MGLYGGVNIQGEGLASGARRDWDPTAFYAISKHVWCLASIVSIFIFDAR